MTMPPEPPPEGVLIESARKQQPEISIREAARRARISEGWWRQVVKGYQSHSGGTYGIVRDVPAETVARMAKATGRITPQQMETEGQRPDVAAVMRAELAAGPVTLVPEPARPDFTAADDDDPVMQEYLKSMTREIYHAVGVEFIPGQEPADDPHLDELISRLPGEYLFSLEAEQRTWNASPGTARQKRHTIARNRRLVAEWQAEQHRIGGLRSESAHWYPCGSRVHVHAGQPAG